MSCRRQERIWDSRITVQDFSRSLAPGPRWPLLIFLGLLLQVQLGCLAPHHHSGIFEVLRDKPDYVLRSPDSTTTPFPEILRRYSGFAPGQDWIDLRPNMELRVENAYYREGTPKHGLAGFLGTEIALYHVQPRGGLRLLSVESMKERPTDQLPVQQLIDSSHQRFRLYRFFFALIFRRSANARGSVLLGASAKHELDALTKRLLDSPESVCGTGTMHCTVFPEACSVSLELGIKVNGTTRTVPLGSAVATVVVHPRYIKMLRSDFGRMAPVQIDVNDPEALRLPLLPNDQITWN